MVGKTEYETSSLTLGSFLSADDATTLQIPHYQRGYSWKNAQVADFMEDLLEQSTYSYQYYFGTITTINKKESNGSIKFELIDGQQRTTTSIILLTCLRDIFYEMDSPIKDEIDKEIFNMDIDKAKNEHYKLILDDDDDLFFRDNILNKLSKSKVKEIKDEPTELETHVNLKNAYLKIRASLDEELAKKKTDQEKIAFLNKLRSTLRKKFVVSNLDVEDPGRAYTLFNRMNDRGLSLAPTDLAKDFILSQVDAEANAGVGSMTKEVGIKKWVDLENKNKKKKGKMNNYLHHYLVTYHSKNTDPAKKDEFIFNPNSATFDQLVRIIKKEVMTGGGLLDDLSSKFNEYDEIKKAPATKHPKISDDCKLTLDWINKLGILILYPVLMAGMNKYSKDDFTKLADIALKWFFRVKTVANKNASALEDELAQIAYHILNKNMSFNDVKHKFVNSKFNISDNAFESYMDEIAIGNTVAKYILIKIFEFQQKQKITDVVPSKNISLEHIMPQNGIDKKVPVPKLKSDGTIELDSSGKEIREIFVWNEYIKRENKISDPRDVSSFHLNYKNRLGNLTIVDRKKNSFLGVNPFSIKCNAGKDKKGDAKGCFKNSQIFLTKKIADWDKWSKKEIEERQVILSKLARDIWKI